MNKEQFDEFVNKFGIEAGTKMKELATEVEQKLNKAFEDKMKGLITAEQFDQMKKDIQENELKSLNDQLKRMEDVAKEQGGVIDELKEKLKGNGQARKTLKDFLSTVQDKIKEMKNEGRGFLEFTGQQLKDAGVTSIGGSVQAMDAPPSSPYLPGLGGVELELFDIMRDPNYILNQVDMGSTNQSRLAWINETAYEGTPGTDVAEGGAKPLTQHKFKVEFSTAKKAAAYIEITEEFEDDIPGLATAVRRMLRDDVIRQFDSQIQTDVIAKARGYVITELNGQIAHANYWSALRAMIGQIASYNFTANTIGLNPLSAVILDEQKNVEGSYLIPPYVQRVRAMTVEANKVAFNYALVGDLRQYKVDMYKDFFLRIGWINDNLILNKFCIVGELRYHSYISDNRRNAICYDNIPAIVDTIDDQTVS